MKKKLLLLALVCAVPLTESCVGAAQALYTAGGAVLSARGGYQAYKGMKMAKAIREAEPIVKDYDAVKVDVLLNPREGAPENLQEAFKDNVKWMIEKDFEVIGLEKKPVCEDNCPPKTLVVQFREEGYGENLAQKLLAGEKLRGKLYYIDMSTGTVVREEPMEVANNYADLIKEINLSFGTKLLKELEKPGNEEKLKKAVDDFNKFNPIKPEYRELFKGS